MKTTTEFPIVQVNTEPEGDCLICFERPAFAFTVKGHSDGYFTCCGRCAQVAAAEYMEEHAS